MYFDDNLRPIDIAKKMRVSKSAITQVLKKDKYIFICRYYCADPVKTIADALGLSVSEIYRELSKIKEKLKAKLIKEGLWNESGKL